VHVGGEDENEDGIIVSCAPPPRALPPCLAPPPSPHTHTDTHAPCPPPRIPRGVCVAHVRMCICGVS